MNKRGLCRQAVSVRLSVRPSVCPSRSCILSKRINIISSIFSPSSSHTILVFPYQTLWQYSNGTTLTGGVEFRWVKKIAFSTNIWQSDRGRQFCIFWDLHLRYWNDKSAIMSVAHAPVAPDRPPGPVAPVPPVTPGRPVCPVLPRSPLTPVSPGKPRTPVSPVLPVITATNRSVKSVSFSQ